MADDALSALAAIRSMVLDRYEEGSDFDQEWLGTAVSNPDGVVAMVRAHLDACDRVIQAAGLHADAGLPSTERALRQALEGMGTTGPGSEPSDG